MESLKFEFRATNIEHSCSYEGGQQPDHSPDHLNCIDDVIRGMQSMSFEGEIKSPKNNYQIDLNFDTALVEHIKRIGWQPSNSDLLKNSQEIRQFQPDAILGKNGKKVVVEIEKTNKKSIWFDFIKILSLTGELKQADFGILIVPRNWPHSKGVWNLFNDARYYKSCLIKYAKIDTELLSKIAIVGYEQEINRSGEWKRYNKDLFIEIKKQAKTIYKRTY